MRPGLIVLLLLLGACGPLVPPLENTQASPSALAGAVLSALERRDLVALRALAVTEQEFRDHVWPELPAARPERNLPFSYVWGDLRQKSDASLSNTMAAHGGKHYDLVAVRSLGEVTPYETYLVHRETELAVKDVDGAAINLRVFGSILEKDGQFKVFSYVVD